MSCKHHDCSGVRIWARLVALDGKRECYLKNPWVFFALCVLFFNDGELEPNPFFKCFLDYFVHWIWHDYQTILTLCL